MFWRLSIVETGLYLLAWSEAPKAYFISSSFGPKEPWLRLPGLFADLKRDN